MHTNLKSLGGLVYSYGSMIIPNELVFYKKASLFAMVPLASRLQERKVFSPNFNKEVRCHDCSQEESIKYEGLNS